MIRRLVSAGTKQQFAEWLGCDMIEQGWVLNRVASRDWSANPTACADVERWLVEKAKAPVFAERVVYEHLYLGMMGHVDCEPGWRVGYYYTGHFGDDVPMIADVCYLHETDSDPIAARMLAVCRLAVRVAMELKALGGK